MSHPDGLPDLFVDRSLGRIKVPALLRNAGLRLVTLAEHYGIPADETVPDQQWLELAGTQGWAVLMKDTASDTTQPSVKPSRATPSDASACQAKTSPAKQWPPDSSTTSHGSPQPATNPDRSSTPSTRTATRSSRSATNRPSSKCRSALHAKWALLLQINRYVQRGGARECR